jgi:hypothetical protein
MSKNKKRSRFFFDVFLNNSTKIIYFLISLLEIMLLYKVSEKIKIGFRNSKKCIYML